MGDWRADRVGAALRGDNPTVLRRMSAGFAVMGDVQFLPGYCVLITESPGIDRLTDLPRDRRLAFLDDLERRWRDPAPETVLGPQHDDLRSALVAELTRLTT